MSYLEGGFRSSGAGLTVRRDRNCDRVANFASGLGWDLHAVVAELYGKAGSNLENIAFEACSLGLFRLLGIFHRRGGGNRFGDALHRELSGDLIGVALQELDAGRFERDVRVLFRVQPTLAAQVFIAQVKAGADRGNVDHDLARTGLLDGVEHDGAGDFVGSTGKRFKIALRFHGSELLRRVPCPNHELLRLSERTAC